MTRRSRNNKLFRDHLTEELIQSNFGRADYEPEIYAALAEAGAEDGPRFAYFVMKFAFERFVPGAKK